MTSLLSTKLGIGILMAVLGGGAIIAIWIYNPSPTSTSSSTLVPLVSSEVHTANWYVVHPDILKQDQARCAGDASTISQAECQNASAADEQLTLIDMQRAAQENGAAGIVSGPPENKQN